MEQNLIFEITEITQSYKINECFIYECIEREWIIPVDSKREILDEEDIARILLIKDLKEDFGVNDESIPIILHLIDQLNWSRMQINHCLKNLENGHRGA